MKYKRKLYQQIFAFFNHIQKNVLLRRLHLSFKSLNGILYKFYI